MVNNILNTLEIHQLSQAQYDSAKTAGTLNENALYLTPAVATISRIKGAILSDTANWSDNIYIKLNTDYPATAYDLDVELDGSATAAQEEAWNDANFVSSAENNLLVAKGVKPTIDLPIIITIFRK